MKYERTYIPPYRRPHLFTRTGWMLVFIGSCAFVLYFVGLAWIGGAFYNLLK